MSTTCTLPSGLTYQVQRRPRKRNISISVSLDGSVTVSGPRFATAAQFESAIRAKEDWVRAKQAEFAQRRSRMPQRQFASGEMLPLLDEEYPIEYLVSRRKRIAVAIEEHSFLVYMPYGAPIDRDELVRAFEHAYIQYGKRMVPERIALYAPRLGVVPSGVTIKRQKRRWGSCNPVSKHLNFNWRLMMAPMWVLDYVVVHELAHLVHADHSKAFWAVVGKACPNWRRARQWLNDNGLSLTLDGEA